LSVKNKVWLWTKVNKHIPVILLTAKFQQSDRERFTVLDVVAIFAKPFRPLKLAEQISQVLGS
jgi:CheY-like chemotaxis protein